MGAGAAPTPDRGARQVRLRRPQWPLSGRFSGFPAPPVARLEAGWYDRSLQKARQPLEKSMTDSSIEPVLKDFPAQRAIALEHRGSYDEIGQVYRRLVAWANASKVRIAGKGRTVFLDSPSEIIPESARYLVCIPVEGDAEGDDEVRVERLPAQKAYCYTHKGPYKEMPAKYAELHAWAALQQYEIAGPPFEIYHKIPAAVGSEEDLVTEICLPVDD
jgi:effector-binding domain-containing protein